MTATASATSDTSQSFASKEFTRRRGLKTPYRKDGDRQVTSTHVLSTDEAGTSRVVEVSTYHSKDTKSFFSTARVAHKKSENGFTVTTYNVFGGTYVTLPRVPVARFSAQGLLDAHDEAMRDLAYHYGRRNAKVLALFDETSEV